MLRLVDALQGQGCSAGIGHAVKFISHLKQRMVVSCFDLPIHCCITHLHALRWPLPYHVNILFQVHCGKRATLIGDCVVAGSPLAGSAGKQGTYQCQGCPIQQERICRSGHPTESTACLKAFQYTSAAFAADLYSGLTSWCLSAVQGLHPSMPAIKDDVTHIPIEQLAEQSSLPPHTQWSAGNQQRSHTDSRARAS
jgi:hypothetical protein